MARSKVRERLFVGADARTIFCPCGKRLAILWPMDRTGSVARARGGADGGIDGAWLGAEVTHGTYHRSAAGETKIKNTAHEDWISVSCYKCSDVWQGREGYLAALIAGVAPGGRVTLGDTPRPRWRRSTDLSW